MRYFMSIRHPNEIWIWDATREQGYWADLLCETELDREHTSRLTLPHFIGDDSFVEIPEPWHLLIDVDL